MDENDDRGRPPYRTPRAMDDDAEEEFVWQWCDHYLGKAGLDGVVAYLSEYAEQAEREEREAQAEAYGAQAELKRQVGALRKAALKLQKAGDSEGFEAKSKEANALEQKKKMKI